MTVNGDMLDCGCIVGLAGIEEPCADIASAYANAQRLVRLALSATPAERRRMTELHNEISRHLRSSTARTVAQRRRLL